MTTYARIENGIVAELIAGNDHAIADRFPPDVAATIVEAPDDVAEGWAYTAGQFSAPAVIAPKRNVQAEIDEIERASMTNRGARELQLAIMRKEGAENGLLTDDAIAAKVTYFRKLKAVDDQIRALRGLL